MPNGREFGMFTPTEAAYTKPGAYGVATGTEATKRGAYLSSLEQYYTELEERRTEFTKGLAWEKERWGGELELRQTEMGLRRETMKQQERLARRTGMGGVSSGVDGTAGMGSIMFGPTGKAIPLTQRGMGKYGQPYTEPVSAWDLAQEWNRQTWLGEMAGTLEEEEEYKFPWE